MQLARKFLIPNIFRLFNKPKESSSQMIFFFFVLSVVGMVPCPTRTGVCRVDLWMVPGKPTTTAYHFFSSCWEVFHGRQELRYPFFCSCRFLLFLFCFTFFFLQDSQFSGEFYGKRFLRSKSHYLKFRRELIFLEKQIFYYIHSTEVSLGFDKISAKSETMQYVSILSTLEMLLDHEDVLCEVINLKTSEPNIYERFSIGEAFNGSNFWSE